MRAPELEAEFPGLLYTAYQVRSPPDPEYNCIAHAVGDVNRFWYDANVRGYYWPPGEPSAEGPEHVARQRASGLWTSKMGKGVVKIMKRPCKDGKRVLE
jgi:hypothetical protein